MQLGSEETTLRVGHEVIRLRPTLRAAMRLERHHGGFGPLLERIAELNTTAMADVIEECSGEPCDLVGLLHGFGSHTLATGLEIIAGPLLSLVLALAGLDHPETPDAVPATTEQAKRITFAEHHAKLFERATGVLGWSPDTAWNATPAEIEAALTGRYDLIHDLLRAVFGGKSDDQPGSVEHDEVTVSTGLADLKAMQLTGGNKGA